MIYSIFTYVYRKFGQAAFFYTQILLGIILLKHAIREFEIYLKFDQVQIVER